MAVLTGRAVPPHRVIRGEGREEACWQAWLAGPQGPVLAPLAHWAPCGTRLLVLAPHPDDEILMAGGLLHLHAARGGICQVVVLSDGEASHAKEPGWDAWALARQRRRESGNGLHLLAPGVPVQRWALPDGALGQHGATIASRLQAMLHPGDLLLTTWRQDGHPDHEAAGLAAAQAAHRCQARLLEAPVWMWHWARPGDGQVPWHRLAGLVLPSGVVARKQSALRCHHSQLLPRQRAGEPVLGEAIVARAGRRVEYLFTALP